MGRLDTLPKEIMEHMEIFQGDIRDPNGVSEEMKNCDAVYNLAALIAIPFSYHSSDVYGSLTESQTKYITDVLKKGLNTIYKDGTNDKHLLLLGKHKKI